MRLIRERLRTLADEGGFTLIAVLGANLMVTTAGHGGVGRDQWGPAADPAGPAAEARPTRRRRRGSRTTPTTSTTTAATGPDARTSRRRTRSTSRARPQPQARPGLDGWIVSYAIELIPATGQSACSSSNPDGHHARVERPEHRHLPHPFDRLLGRREAVDRRHLQAGDLPRLRLLHAARDLGPGDLRLLESLVEPDAAYAQCTKFRRDGRPRRGTTNPSSICDTIVFVDGDHINGPMHTNDDFCINGNDTPNMGRNAADVVEVAASPPGYHSASSSGNGCTGGAVKPSPGNLHHQRSGAHPAYDEHLAEDLRGTGVHLHGPDDDHPQRRDACRSTAADSSRCRATAWSTSRTAPAAPPATRRTP